MSSAHDVLVRSAPGAVRAAIGAAIGAATVVEPVAPRWRWRIITPGQWRVLSRIGRRARVGDLFGDLAGPGDAAAAAEIVDRLVELVQAGLCVLEGVSEPAVGDVPRAGPEPSDPHRRLIAVVPWPDDVAPVAEPLDDSPDDSSPDDEPPAAEHKAPAAPDAGEDVADDVPGVLPRREPGRTLSPVAAILQRRHAQVRRTAEETFTGPDTEILRRLLGGLQLLEDGEARDQDIHQDIDRSTDG